MESLEVRRRRWFAVFDALNEIPSDLQGCRVASLELLSLMVGQSKRSVVSSLQCLAELGLIEKVHRCNEHGGQLASGFRILKMRPALGGQ